MLDLLSTLIAAIDAVPSVFQVGMDTFLPALTGFLGAPLEAIGSVVVLAQADGLGSGIKTILTLLRMIAFLLAVGALIISGIMFAQGRVEAAIYGVVAAGILALSGAIVNFAFSKTGDDLGIDL